MSEKTQHAPTVEELLSVLADVVADYDDRGVTQATVNRARRLIEKPRPLPPPVRKVVTKDARGRVKVAEFVGGIRI